MALEDYMQSEVAVAAAASALMFSSRARQLARRGLVLGVAGGMKAADAIGSAARDMAGEAQSVASTDGGQTGGSRPARSRQAARA